MNTDTLCFDAVRADDPLVTGPQYVDISVDVLPDVGGENLWWKVLPPSGELVISGFGYLYSEIIRFLVSLRVDPPLLSSTVPLELDSESSNRPGPVLDPKPKLTIKLNGKNQTAPAHAAESSTKGEPALRKLVKRCVNVNGHDRVWVRKWKWKETCSKERQSTAAKEKKEKKVERVH
jgi:hypothetical protein